jgi:hypothetical protein
MESNAYISKSIGFFAVSFLINTREPFGCVQKVSGPASHRLAQL